MLLLYDHLFVALSSLVTLSLVTLFTHVTSCCVLHLKYSLQSSLYCSCGHPSFYLSSFRRIVLFRVVAVPTPAIFCDGFHQSCQSFVVHILCCSLLHLLAKAATPVPCYFIFINQSRVTLYHLQSAVIRD